MQIKANSNLLDPNKVHVVNRWTGKVYADFELDIEARQYMRNMLLKETGAPADDDQLVPKIWVYDARGAETTSF
jgi:hypothetical protein|tara:strand:+ start:82 stop:303 length:222 start_codon:yes stop_codon:yes gene_type:complete